MITSLLIAACLWVFFGAIVTMSAVNFLDFRMPTHRIVAGILAGPFALHRGTWLRQDPDHPP